MGFEGIARNGISHQYAKSLIAFEHTPKPAPNQPQNLLLFVGGLFDGLHTVPYTAVLANALPPSWTLAEVLLSSSYRGWGTSSLTLDAEELSLCISYFHTIKTGKIVLMGNSTGCQDILAYLSRNYSSRSPINAGIMHAPVSDRETLLMLMEPESYKQGCEDAQALVSAGNGEEILSSKAVKQIFPAPVTARRWLSLASPNHDGDDDFFSSDLTDEQLMKTFGALPKNVPLCVLQSGMDEYVPESIDTEALRMRWIEVAKRGEGRIDEVFSGVVEEATHNLSGDEEDVVQALVEKVIGFLRGLTPLSNI